jgi:hypothetical protein
MPSIQLSDDAAKKIRAFGRIIDAILGSENSPKTESKRTELVVSVGLDHMLRDVLPKEEMLLNTMTQMFNLNPEFVCQFVADAIKEGKEEQTKQADDARKRWGLYA